MPVKVPPLVAPTIPIIGPIWDDVARLMGTTADKIVHGYRGFMDAETFGHLPPDTRASLVRSLAVGKAGEMGFSPDFIERLKRS